MRIWHIRISHSVLHLHVVIDCDALLMVKHFLSTFSMKAPISQDIDRVSVVNTSTTLYELCLFME